MVCWIICGEGLNKSSGTLLIHFVFELISKPQIQILKELFFLPSVFCAGWTYTYIGCGSKSLLYWVHWLIELEKQIHNKFFNYFRTSVIRFSSFLSPHSCRYTLCRFTYSLDKVGIKSYVSKTWCAVSLNF